MAKRLGGRKMRNLHKLPLVEGNEVITPKGKGYIRETFKGFVDVELEPGAGNRFHTYEVRLANDPDNVVRKRN